MTQALIQKANHYLKNLQDTICQALETIDGANAFHEDQWQRPEGGGGRTRVLQNGNIFEQAGVNFSHVFGKELPPAATKRNPDLAGTPFEAAGISLVLHPHNPHIPTTHANFRYFSVTGKTVWFGGGYDLTPYYPYEEDVIHWHTTARDACIPFGKNLYPTLKKQCDEYFYLPHRKETRGVGGLFFDDFVLADLEKTFAFVQAVGNSFLPAYLPMVEKRKNTPFSAKERTFQCYRRGRYVEFNLLYDRGTLFGLQSNGRTESILMSLPPQVHWQYNWKPEPGTPEALLYDRYLEPQDWLT